MENYTVPDVVNVLLFIEHVFHMTWTIVKVLLFIVVNVRGFKYHRQQSMGELYFVGILLSWFK